MEEKKKRSGGEGRKERGRKGGRKEGRRNIGNI